MAGFRPCGKQILMELLETPLKKKKKRNASPGCAVGDTQPWLKAAINSASVLFPKGNSGGDTAYNSAFALSFDLLPSPHVSPVFPEGLFGVLLVDGAFGVFNWGSWKEFAARDKIGRTCRRADRSQHDPCQPQLSLPLSLLPPATFPGLPVPQLLWDKVLVRCSFLFTFSCPLFPLLSLLFPVGLWRRSQHPILAEKNFLGFAGWMERAWWCKIIKPGCDLELWRALSQQVSASRATGDSAGTAQGCVVGIAPLCLFSRSWIFPLSGALLQVLSIFLLLTGTEAFLPVKSWVYTRKLGSLYCVGSEKGFVWVLVLYPSFVFCS